MCFRPSIYTFPSPSILLQARLRKRVGYNVYHYRLASQAVRKQVVGNKETPISSISQNNFPLDWGVLPGTIIMPRLNWSNFSYMDLIRIKWQGFKSWLADWRSLMAWKYSYKTKPIPKLARRQLAPLALALHQKLYTALAEGNLRVIQSLCCEGLESQLAKRIRSRPHSETVEWSLHNYRGSAPIVSDRSIALPRSNCAIRQVIFRIRSRQSQRRTNRTAALNNNTIEGSADVKEIEEYFVIQKLMFDAIEGPWKIWGTSKEADPKTLLCFNKK